MQIDAMIERVRLAVKALLEQEGSGHDWQHILRVWTLGLRFGREENADLFILSLSLLLHDVDDRKVTGDITTETTLINSRRIMAEAGVPPFVIEQVCETILSTGFHKSLGGEVHRSLEAHILSDADQLDAIGAIGIARTFVYGASKHRPMFCPDVAPMENFTKEQYVLNQGSTVAHFFEKLLHLKDMMFTSAGKREGLARHLFMVGYLEQFFEEAAAPAIWKQRLQEFRS